MADYNYMQTPKIKTPQQPKPPSTDRVARPVANQTAYTPGFGGGASQQPQGTADRMYRGPGFSEGPSQQPQQLKTNTGAPGSTMQPWGGGTLNAGQIQQQSNAANNDWAKQNQAWASGQGTAAQQAQAQGYMAQQGQTAYTAGFGGGASQQPTNRGVSLNGGKLQVAKPVPNQTSYPAGHLAVIRQQNQYGTSPGSVSYNPGAGGGSASGSQWNLPSFNPSNNYTPIPGQTQTATPGGGSQNFWDSSNPWNVDMNDPNSVNKINTLYPIGQFDQSNYQYANDFNAAKERWNAEFGLTQNQTNFQQQLSTQQQQAAEQQSAIAAEQWNQQFGHTQQMDVAGLDLSQQQINNQANYWQGQNAANMYGSDQQLAGQLGSAEMYSNAQMYGSDNQLAGQQYQSDQQLAGTLGSAGMYSDAQKYQAQLGLQGQMGSAGLYSNAQMYGANQQLAGTLGAAQYGLQGTLGSAGMYSGAQRYQTDAQERMNQLQMQNNLQVANTQAYGRSQAPQASWARNWG